MNMLVLLFFNMAFAQSTFDGLQTGRYEIHKSAQQIKTTKATVKKSGKIEISKNPERTTASEFEKKAEMKIQSDVLLAPPVVVKVEQKDSVEKAEPTIAEQVQSLASGDATPVYDFYREQVHPDDVRNNRVEIEVSPGIVSNESKSNYSFREYKNFFHAVTVGANIWFTPLVGISGHYTFSLAADVGGDTATNSKIAANYEFIDLAVNLRRFFGLSRLSKSAEFDLLYSENKMKTPTDNVSRGRINSTGFGLGIKARLPISVNYAWVLGASFFPRVQHSESATGIALNSGSSADSAKAGLDIGGEFKFNRESQIIWNLSATAEKNLFSGNASLPDPATGATPENVSVTNTMLIFNLGYRWGQ